MMITFSKHSADDPKGATAQDAVSYPTAEAIPKPGPGGSKQFVRRDPVPEILNGDTTLMRAAIRAAPGERKYRSCVLSFAASDIDCTAFNAADPKLRSAIDLAIRLWIDVAFAGIPETCRPPVLATTHTHLDRLEVNLLVPRWVTRSDGAMRSFNPDPPGPAGRATWEAVEDLLNGRFGWADPRDPARRRAVQVPDWQLKERAAALRTGCSPEPDLREKLATTLLDDVNAGRIVRRADVLERLREIGAQEGFIIHGTGADHITIGAPDAQPIRRQRLQGLLFIETFHAPEDLLPDPGERRRQAMARAAILATAPSRLQTRWQARAAFNQSRYGLGAWPEPVFKAWTQVPLAMPPRLIPARRLTAPKLTVKKEIANAQSAPDPHPDGTPAPDALAEPGGGPAGAGCSTRYKDRRSRDANTRARSRDRELDRYARELAGPTGPGMIFTALIARFKALIPNLHARAVLHRLAKATPVTLSVQLSHLQHTLEFINGTLSERLGHQFSSASEHACGTGTVRTNQHDATDADRADHASPSTSGSTEDARRRYHKPAGGRHESAFGNLDQPAKISRQYVRPHESRNPVAGPPHVAVEDFHPAERDGTASVRYRENPADHSGLAERTSAPHASRAALLSHLCSACAAVSAGVPVRIRIAVRDLSHRPTAQDEGSPVSEEDNVIVPFLFAPDETWTISGPNRAVHAVMEAVGIDRDEPRLDTMEEDRAEPEDDMAPEIDLDP